MLKINCFYFPFNICVVLSVRVLETRNIDGSEVFPDEKLEPGWLVSDDKIELQRAALIENSENGLVRIVFVAFDRLETILKPSYSEAGIDGNAIKYFESSKLSGGDTTAASATPSSFSSLSPSLSAHQQTTTNVRKRILNSKVISASLGKGRHIQLSQPVRLILKHLKTENVTNPTCVFWNYIDQ